MSGFASDALIRPGLATGGGRPYVSSDAVAIGDSMTAWGSANSRQWGHVRWNLLGIVTNQRIRMSAFYATAGYTIEQIEAAHLPQVLAMNPLPGYCFIFAGTNNLGGNWNVANTATVLNRMIAALMAKGIVPVLTTISPRDSSPSGQNQLAQWNAYVRHRSSQLGLPMFESHASIVNPTTGGYATGMLSTTDGTGVHMSDLAHLTVAKANANDPAFMAQFPNAGLTLVRNTNDQADGLGNYGLFLNDSNADGVGNSWGLSNVPSTATPSLLTDTAALGQWQRLSRANAQTGTASVFISVPTSAYKAGDLCYVGARVRQDADAGVTQILQAVCQGVNITFDTRWHGVVDGTAYVPFTVPAGTTNIQINLMITGTATATVNTDYAQVSFINRSALGLT